MSHSDIQIAIRRYARQHRLLHNTVSNCLILRYAAIRAFKQEALLRSVPKAA